MDLLFSQTSIKGLPLKNRVVALPVFTGYALPDGRVSPLMLEHYQRLARSGASMVVVPNVAVSKDGRTSERSLLIDQDSQINDLKRLANVIKENDALACIQLNHAGRYAVSDRPMLPSALDSAEALKSISTLKNFMESFPFVKRFGLTAHVAKMTAGWGRQMSEADIHQVISLFGEAAHRAVQAGFDMIELHGATGYLIAQFLSPRLNRREAPWGGSPQARMGFALSILEEVKRRIPDSVPVGFRFILEEIVKGGISTNEAMSFARELEEHGASYLSATVGTYQSMFIPKVSKHLAKPGYFATKAGLLTKQASIPVVISGRILSPKLAEKILQKGEADLIGLGRPLLADPDWIKKATTKKPIIGCKNCNTCFQHVALGESLICERWPKVVKDRIKLETRFTSRHGYRTLIVFSSVSDLQIAEMHVKQRVPIHRGILDRQLFLDTGEDKGFMAAAQEYARWSEQSYHRYLNRVNVENIFLEQVNDPVRTVMDQLEEDFGFISTFHDPQSLWKQQLILNVPADMVAFRAGSHPNLRKALIPCDLSTFTLMQIRVAHHLFHGREDTEFQFVHVTRYPQEALDKWKAITESFAHKELGTIKILQPEHADGVAESLLKEVRDGQYGCLIMGRRGGFARVRRRIFGSVSERLLSELPECSFALVG